MQARAVQGEVPGVKESVGDGHAVMLDGAQEGVPWECGELLAELLVCSVGVCDVFVDCVDVSSVVYVIFYYTVFILRYDVLCCTVFSYTTVYYVYVVCAEFSVFIFLFCISMFIFCILCRVVVACDYLIN